MLRIALTLTLFLSQFFAAQPAQAACTPGSGAAFSTGSAIVANQVVLCANAESVATTIKRSQTTVTRSQPAIPVVVVKPLCPDTMVTTAQIVAAALLGCKIIGPSNPPAAVVVTKPKVAQSSALSQQTDSAAFSPNDVTAFASPGQATVFSAILLTSNAVEHERTAIVLGRTAYVRFVPIKFDWLCEGQALGGSIAVASFATPGQKQIDLSVSFDASYRFGLSDAWIAVGVVTRSASTQVIAIDAPKQVAPKTKPRLVWTSCQKHLSNYRC